MLRVCTECLCLPVGTRSLASAAQCEGSAACVFSRPDDAQCADVIAKSEQERERGSRCAAQCGAIKEAVSVSAHVTNAVPILTLPSQGWFVIVCRTHFELLAGYTPALQQDADAGHRNHRPVHAAAHCANSAVLATYVGVSMEVATGPAARA